MDAVVAEAANDVLAPDGYESVDDFLAEARTRFQEGVDADRDNRDAALDDLKFTAGEQWDESIKAAREAKGRPCLTINDLPQYVGQVIGDTRTNRPSIKVRPAEEGDKKIAEIRQGLIRSIENLSNANQVYALAGEDQVTCGLGHFRVGLEYVTDDAFDQDIRIRHIPNPFAVVWDPLSTEATGADARFAFVVDEMSRVAFEEAYPDATTSELTVPTNDGGWVSRDSVRVTEYWTMVDRTRTLALLHTGEVADITDRDSEFAGQIAVGIDGRPRRRQVVDKIARMYLITGQDVLDGPYDYPISRIPVFKVTGREVRVADRRYRFGLIRFAKDPIRMKNLWRSSAAEWLAMAPKQQWLIHASDGEQANQYRNAAKSGDPVLVWQGDKPPQRMDPPSAPNALLQEAIQTSQDVKDVTGLHDASLGMKSNETSGKAILARERQGDTATFMYHDNLSLSIRECGKVINEFIPLIYDQARTVMVLGEDGSTTPHRVNDEAAPEFIDLKAGKYDIVVETGPSYSTKRVEAAESMLAFMQAVPQAGQFAADLVAKAQDWPMAEEIGERLKKALPPQFQSDDNEELTPEQQQAKAQQAQAAQQQQAMQQRAAELELAEREAKVEQTRADAAYKMAQAANLGKGETRTALDDAQDLIATREAEAKAEEAEARAKSAKIAAERAEFELRVLLAGNPNAAAQVDPEAGDKGGQQAA